MPEEEIKDVMTMTRREFYRLPHRSNDEDLFCSNIIILPATARYLHDSGYRCMDFVAVDGSRPICRLAGGSDVLHIDGIMGRSSIADSAWSIDCLPVSGLLRLWTRTGRIKVGLAYSSFEIFAVEREKEDGSTNNT